MDSLSWLAMGCVSIAMVSSICSSCCYCQPLVPCLHDHIVTLLERAISTILELCRMRSLVPSRNCGPCDAKEQPKSSDFRPVGRFLVLDPTKAAAEITDLQVSTMDSIQLPSGYPERQIHRSMRGRSLTLYIDVHFEAIILYMYTSKNITK